MIDFKSIVVRIDIDVESEEQLTVLAVESQ